MRALLFVVLAAHVALAIWGATRAPVRPPRDEVPMAPVAVGDLRLLAEVDGPRAVPTPEPSTRDPVCARAGPFQQQADGVSAVTRARSLGLGARLSALDLDTGVPDIQVLLPAAPSYDEALRRVRELAGLGIEAYAIAEGPASGSVSVGVFTDRAAAQARAAELVAAGYEVDLRPLERRRRVWDVALRSPERETLDAFLLGLRRDWPELSVDRASCDDVSP